MADLWRALGMTTIQALLESTAAPQPLGPSFDIAFTILRQRLHQMRTLANGGNAVTWQEIDLVNPTAMLGEALRAFAAYNELHNRFVRALSVYGGLLDVLVLADNPLWRRNLTLLPAAAADPVWQSWVQSRAHALECIHQALRRLRAVAAYDLASGDAFTVARSFPEHSPDSMAWMRAAESLAARADAEALAAKNSQFNMYVAVRQECIYAVQILNR